jgi:hypothetical protein
LQSLLERRGQSSASPFPGETQGPPRRFGSFAESACFRICGPECVERLLIAARDELLRIPGELADTLAAEADASKCAAIVRAAVDRAIARFAELEAKAPQDDAHDAPGGPHGGEGRVAVLERRAAKRSACAAKRGYADVPQAECDRRWNLRVEYENTKFLETCNRIYSRRRGDHLPTSLTYFAEHVRDERFNLRELQRFFSRRNTFATVPEFIVAPNAINGRERRLN